MIDHIGFAVLAGGKSSRMRSDKRMLRINGISFLEAVLDAGRGFSERIVSFDRRQPEIENRLNDSSLKIVYDDVEGMGPLIGIRQILRSSEHSGCLIVATDMPFLSSEFLVSLAACRKDNANTVLVHDGLKEPLCSIYDKSCIPVIDTLIEQKRLRPAFLFEAIPTQYVDIQSLGYSPSVIRNFNDINDYNSLLKKSK